MFRRGLSDSPKTKQPGIQRGEKGDSKGQEEEKKKEGTGEECGAEEGQRRKR